VTLLEAITELLVFARENGDLEGQLGVACRRAERRILQMRIIHTKRAMFRKRLNCSRCARRSAEILCWQCQADAPVKVRRAFQMAVGLDGMRAAARMVKEYASGDFRERKAA
jgi:hypothetical protein